MAKRLEVTFGSRLNILKAIMDGDGAAGDVEISEQAPFSKASLDEAMSQCLGKRHSNFSGNW